MRTIVACLFTALLVSAQTPTDLDKLEKSTADRADNVTGRTSLLIQLTNNNSWRADKVREVRRRTILWLIEHHPEAKFFADPQYILPVSGTLADPNGAEEAARLWKDLARAPGAKNEVIANAAIYLRATDIPSARAMLEGRSDDPVLSRARGLVDGAAMVGLFNLGQGLHFGTQSALRSTPAAKAAQKEIEGSADAYLVGKAGTVLAAVGGQIEAPYDLTFGDDDGPTLGEKWLRRAISLAPPGDEWKPALSQALQVKANRTIDPHEKVRLLREANSLIPEAGAAGIQINLCMAEFDAGDDAAAERDAQHLLTSAPKNAYAYMIANTVLGRVAVAKGDLVEGKRRMLASVTLPDSLKAASFEPNFTLAQDVYDSGDKEGVLQFLEASRKVWKADRGRIDVLVSYVKKASSVDLLKVARQQPGNEVVRRAAPRFEGVDLDGNRWTREQLAGQLVALEFGKSPLLESVAKTAGAVVIPIHDDDIKRRFEVITDPTLVVIDRDGIVSAFHAGNATEAEWRVDFSKEFRDFPLIQTLSVGQPSESIAGSQVSVSWLPVGSAESYVVEWDYRGEKGWMFDLDKTVRVIPTREMSATIDLNGFTRIRWRVYAVARGREPGKPSSWREIEGIPLTKIYK